MRKKLLIYLIIVSLICSIVNIHVVAVYSDYMDNIETDFGFSKEISAFIKEDKNYFKKGSFPLSIIGKSKSTLKNSWFQNANKVLIGDDNRFFLQFNSQRDVNECLDFLNSCPDIIYAQQDQIIESSAIEGTTDKHISWGVDALKIDSFIDSCSSSFGNKEVIVAVVDSGIASLDYFKDRTVEGYDFVDNDYDASNDTHPQSHGTFLASIIADCTKGTNIKIMPVRVLSSKTGSLINITNGIRYAADSGADIINVSIGGVLNECGDFDDAILYAKSKDSVVVVSAGNASMNTINYCPSHNEIPIVVSSIDEDLMFSKSFSNYGDTVDVCAPGHKINGLCSSGEVKTLSGTSMSAAYVSACAALFRKLEPDSSEEQVQQVIKESCMDLGDSGWNQYYGHGIPQMDKFANDEIKIVTKHKFTDWTVIRQATCFSFGEKEKICMGCGKAIYESIEKIPHDYVSQTFKPTCTMQGYTLHTCSICGAKYSDNVIQATGHNDANHDGICDICKFDFTKTCSCSCHKSRIEKFFWKIRKFFYKLFNLNKYYLCDCGKYHW